jgi:hypothetical protein
MFLNLDIFRIYVCLITIGTFSIWFKFSYEQYLNGIITILQIKENNIIHTLRLVHFRTNGSSD